jgi:hypothetical protein
MTHEQALSTLASERYLLAEMSEEERASFEEHYFGCEECADDVRAAGRLRDGVRAGLAGERASRDNVQDMSHSAAWQRRAAGMRRWYQSAAIPWAAAAALAIVAGYQSLVIGPAPALRQPVALAPVTLRPASRGAVPQVTLPRDSAVVTLAIDAGVSVGAQAGSTSADVPFAIRTQGNAVAASGTVRLPAPGVPLLLLVPRSEIAEPGRYILTIADAEYPFDVVAQ